jgi:protein involved in polysaccharide export with SLBB domain
VFQNPDLTTETRNSERGTITFPLIGEIALAGLTPAGAEARIAEQLIKGKFLLKPQVSLNLTLMRSRQVSVLGQVTRPGRYALDDSRSNLTDILALAGGISATGDDNVIVMVTRNGKTAEHSAGERRRDLRATRPRFLHLRGSSARRRLQARAENDRDAGAFRRRGCDGTRHRPRVENPPQDIRREFSEG